MFVKDLGRENFREHVRRILSLIAPIPLNGRLDPSELRVRLRLHLKLEITALMIITMCPQLMQLTPTSRFFWTRNNGGAVLPVGETRRSADFHVSADLTRTSERRLQAGKFLGFEVLRLRLRAG